MSSLKTLKRLFIVLVATTDCNLRCLYCYVDGGSKKIYMTTALVIETVNAFLKRCRRLEELTITFFGGEPTLNSDLIYKTVRYCNLLPIKARFRIATNGMVENNLWEFILENDFAISLSMDGRPTINNLLRGSSTGLENKIKRLANEGKNFHVRSTITGINIYQFAEAVEWWADLGVKLVHLEIVNAAKGRARENRIYPPCDELLAKEIGRTIETAGRKNIYLMNSAWMNLQNPSDYFCDSCKGFQYIIFPDGNIGGCYMADPKDALLKKLVIGKIDERKIVWNNNNKKLLNSISTSKMNPCKNCEVRKTCGGGCPVRHLFNTGSLFVPSREYCQTKKTMIQLAQDAITGGNNSVLGFEYLSERR